jgi:integrase
MACVKRRRGRWVLDFRDVAGKRHWETYRTREEADTALENRLKQLRQGALVAPTKLPTFEKLAKDWLATKNGHRVSSFAQWQVHLEKHLIPALGPIRLDKIRVKHLEDFRDDRRKAGLSPQTVNKLLTTAAAVFRYAQQHELLERNPAAVVERCRLNTGELTLDGDEEDCERNGELAPKDVLSPEEAGKLIENATPGLYRTFFLTAILTGARVGELTALTWGDVDLEASTIDIRRSLSWARQRGEKGEAKPRFYEPKTKHSRRTVRIGPELVSALKRWKLQCPKGPLNLVFPTSEGTPKHRSTITHKGLRPALKAAKLRRVTLHSFRHSFASALIMGGEPVTNVANLLGHSSPAVTMRIYAHWFKDVKTDGVANLTQRILRGSNLVAEPLDTTPADRVSA